MNLDSFEQLAKTRRAVRSFIDKPIDKELILRLLDSARWAPSGYNLQPTHFFVVTEDNLKQKLQSACLGQKQVTQAPCVVIFAADRNVYQNNLDRIIKEDLSAGALDEKYAAILKKFVGLGFDQGPAGMGWLGKLLVAPLMGLAKPTPSIPAVQKRYWLSKQAMLSAMNFMLAAKSAGLDTVPMEGFDEKRVKECAGIPKSFIVPLLIPVGWSESKDLKKSRLPLESLTHWNKW